MSKTTIKIIRLTSNNPEQTRRAGTLLGQCLQSGDLIALSGELGSGKTTFGVGLGAGWGALDPVTSPTFVMINQYHRADGSLLHHVDAYRLASPADVESIGLLELLNDNATLMIEWPENIAAMLPPERLWIDLDYISATERDLCFTASGSRYEQLLAEYNAAVQANPETQP